MNRPALGEEMKTAKPLTVKQAIKLLSKIADKELRVLIDCPYCGKGNQISAITECVVLSAQPQAGAAGERE